MQSRLVGRHKQTGFWNGLSACHVTSLLNLSLGGYCTSIKHVFAVAVRVFQSLLPLLLFLSDLQ